MSNAAGRQKRKRALMQHYLNRSKWAAALDTTPQMWMNAQMLHDLTRAYSEKRDKKIAGNIKPMEPVLTE